MARKGLIPDRREERVRGLDSEAEDKKALKRWLTLDDDEKAREIIELRDDVAAELKKMGAKDDGQTAELSRLARRFKRSSKKVKAAEAALDKKRQALIDRLQSYADLPVPEDSDSPAAKKVLELRAFLADYKARQDEPFEEAWEKSTDRERIENAYRWCNNMTANNYADARKMGFTPEYVENFRQKIMKFDATITAEERIAHLVDTNTPATKARADLLLGRLDAAKKRSTFITGNDMLGKKGN